MSGIEPSFKNRRTMLDRFIERIRDSLQFFHNKPSRDIKLFGRIQDLQKTAESVLDQLTLLKNHLKNQVDEELFVFIEGVINPLIREFNRIKKSVEQHGSVAKQAQAFKRYSEWIEKGKQWIQVCNSSHREEKIIEEIIHLTVEEFLEVIDRDLQVIEDYTEHMTDNLTIDEEERISLIQKLHEKLDPYVLSLKALKAKPKHIPLQQLRDWKLKVDKRREKYFDAALHAIDKIIGDINPSSVGEEEHSHLVDILGQIAYLEEEVPLLCKDLLNLNQLEEFQQELILVRLSSFHKELHNLNLDLRLPSELIDRLQFLIECLEKADQNLRSE